MAFKDDIPVITLILVIIILILTFLIYYSTWEEEPGKHYTELRFYNEENFEMLDSIAISGFANSVSMTVNGTAIVKSADMMNRTLTFRCNGYQDLELFIDSTNYIHSISLFFESSSLASNQNKAIHVNSVIIDDLNGPYQIVEGPNESGTSAPPVTSNRISRLFGLSNLDYSRLKFQNSNHSINLNLKTIKDTTRIDVVFDNGCF